MSNFIAEFNLKPRQHCIKIPKFHLIFRGGNFEETKIFHRVSDGRQKLCGNCAFPQNFHTRKLDEITVFLSSAMKYKVYFHSMNVMKYILIACSLHWLDYDSLSFVYTTFWLLKELRNYNRKSFLCPPKKIGGKTTNILNCYFSK